MEPEINQQHQQPKQDNNLEQKSSVDQEENKSEEFSANTINESKESFINEGNVLHENSPNKVIDPKEKPNEIMNDSENNVISKPQTIKKQFVIHHSMDCNSIDKNANAIKFEDMKNGDLILTFSAFTTKVVDQNINSITFTDCNFPGEKDDKGVAQTAPSKFLNKPIKLKYINSFPELAESLNDFLPFPISEDNSKFQLTSLRIEKSNIVTSEYNAIMNNIVNDDRLRKHLTYISFAENQIVSVDLKKKYSFNSSNMFDSLEELNFSGNRIYSFRISYIKAINKTKFKLINLIDNQFSSFTELDQPKPADKILCLLNRNLLLTIDENLVRYNDYLKAVIKEFEYESFKFMSFSGLFTKDNCANIQHFILKEKHLPCLIELDLSYCGLNTENAFVFINNHQKMSNIKRLGLRTNFINEQIFNKKQNDTENYELFFQHLKELDLSNNLIEEQSGFEVIYDFIVSHSEMTHLNLQMNPFGKDYTAENNNKDKDKEKEKEKDRSKQSLPVYTTKEINKESNQNKMNFVKLVHDIYAKKPEFQLDFSTESRVFAYSELKKKKYSYDVKVKQKKVK